MSSSIGLAPAFTAALIGLWYSAPPTFESAPEMVVAVLSRRPVASSKGRATATIMRLKKSCTVAAAKARRKALPWRKWPIETTVFVIVVPMLAPMIIGMAVFRDRAVPPDCPTRETMVDVLVLELCTSTVARVPTAKPAKGLETPENSSWAVSLPRALMAEPIRRIEMRNPYTSART